MNEEEREGAIAKWDSRTPLERLESLTKKERRAFIALFYGGRGSLQGSWRADTEKEIAPSFGKAECEWVDFSLWRSKLPGLRLTTYEEGHRRCALGMSPGSVVWDISIGVTDDGLEAYEEYSKENL
jgi:hypothetical protein